MKIRTIKVFLVLLFVCVFVSLSLNPITMSAKTVSNPSVEVRVLPDGSTCKITKESSQQMGRMQSVTDTYTVDFFDPSGILMFTTKQTATFVYDAELAHIHYSSGNFSNKIVYNGFIVSDGSEKTMNIGSDAVLRCKDYTSKKGSFNHSYRVGIACDYFGTTYVVAAE